MEATENRNRKKTYWEGARDHGSREIRIIGEVRFNLHVDSARTFLVSPEIATITALFVFFIPLWIRNVPILATLAGQTTDVVSIRHQLCSVTSSIAAEWVKGRRISDSGLCSRSEDELIRKKDRDESIFLSLEKSSWSATVNGQLPLIGLPVAHRSPVQLSGLPEYHPPTSVHWA